MNALLVIYLLGFLIAMKYAIITGCDDKKKIATDELIFVTCCGIFSWIGVLALIIGYNAKKNR